MTISIDTEKTFDKTQYSFNDLKNQQQQLRYRRSVPQHNKGHI